MFQFLAVCKQQVLWKNKQQRRPQKSYKNPQTSESDNREGEEVSQEFFKLN